VDYPAGTGTTQVTGISNSNLVIGFSTSQEPYIPFIYINGTFKIISVPNASHISALGVSANGAITGMALPKWGEQRGGIHWNLQIKVFKVQQ
jgi:hypothetical protein